MRELSQLKQSPPEGIRVVTSEDNMLDVTGIIEGPEGTPYAGGYYRIRFKFTEEFPAAPPKCWFATKIFHPNVSGQGEICVNTLKKDWKPSFGIAHILVTVKCLLIYPNPESALDEEAGKLLLEDYESYCARARLINSVHATPRTRPPEFDDGKGADGEEGQAGPSRPQQSAAPAPPATLPPHSITLPPPQLSAASPRYKSMSPSPLPPLSQPLQSSPANTMSMAGGAPPGGASKNEKDRRTSPAPLGPADSNIAAGSGAGAAAASGKAIKRTAVGGMTSAEKRKKALKRL
ncbi:hypothetical protein CONPUDRAFT_66675 [Coniophora puteana RWD-64-598 SS2]|uniref:E2 ubiquitin-conjugating enzyme n=1 Tax=Coniophora puteana (strain RWD-64-598) TaxID=741705 RepID=A0A5M3M606_CONPW|nr:uncharacterized protein CONPUDRAFT_66675 [Coniophora puteana RWD-64-598 SS2]EIW74809.1 hypothetical protein CONPUDRAFT_66675 [Coniophora puteana RWD-64-598 SS2]